MKILILHKIPFSKVSYDQWIDHSACEVTYLGELQALSQIPPQLKHFTIGSIEEIRSRPDRIVALSEYDLMGAAMLREKYDVAGPRPDDVKVVRDKIVMKEAVARAGIRTPLACRLSDNPTAEKIANSHNGKIVLKPTDGASSEGIRILEAADWRETQPVIEESELHRYEIEEFVEGNIFHVDGFVDDGVLQRFIVSDYVGNCLDFAKGSPLGSYQHTDSQAAMRRWISRILSAVRINDGAFHLEGIRSTNGLVFLEIGHRVGGAGVAHTFQLRTGMSLYGLHVQSQLGVRKTRHTEKCDSRFYSWFVYPGHLRTDSPARVVGDSPSWRDVAWIHHHKPKRSSGVAGKISYQDADVPFSGELAARDPLLLRNALEELFGKVKVEAALGLPGEQDESERGEEALPRRLTKPTTHPGMKRRDDQSQEASPNQPGLW